MEQAILTDLKQFITRTVTETVAESEKRLHKKIDDLDIGLTNLDRKIDHLDENMTRKIDDLAASVADALDGSNEIVEARLSNHERRIARLERKQVI